MIDHWCCEGTHPEYEFGSAGSLVMRCPKCGRDHFRHPLKILHYRHVETCVFCNDGPEQILQPVKKEVK